MIKEKDVTEHVQEVRKYSQYSITRVFISFIVIVYMGIGIFSGLMMFKKNPLLGVTVICGVILTGAVSKQMSIVVIDIADSLHYQGAKEKFLEYMQSIKQR